MPKLRDKFVKSNSYSVLLKYPDQTTAMWTKVNSLEEVEALKARGFIIVQVEKIVDDFDIQRKEN